MEKKQLITRRKAIITGLTTIGGMLLTGCTRPLPPTYGNILRMGDALTYVAQRTLLPGQSLVREYGYRDISSFPATGTTDPGDSKSKYFNEEYSRLHHDTFTDWRLSIEGLVAKPASYSLADIQKFPSQKQITRHTCEEGWTAIAEWAGVPLSTVLHSVGVLPNARFVSFYSYDDWLDCIDMMDAFHPQTILAYGMNGRALPVPHGAPLRLRVETQIGYKSMKYLKRIVVTDKFVGVGDTGWSWYVGI